MEVQRQEEIFLRKEGNTVINSNNTYGSISNTDWYVNVFLTKSLFIDGYVQINQDNFIYEIERQNINPYFYELGFFETIKEIGYDENSVNYFYGVTTTGNTSDVSSGLFNSIYNVYKPSIELKSNFYAIPITPDPITSTTVFSLTSTLNNIKANVQKNQTSFALEYSATTPGINIIRTVTVTNESDYVFEDGTPVPINTILNYLSDGSIKVSVGIYYNYSVFKTATDTLENTIKPA
jgi:hypothetical protein